MSRIAYVNGRYLPFRDAKVHVEDRGYQFGDGVYEVCEVRGGRLIDQRRHLARLVRSLEELRIPMPMPLAALNIVMREVAARNRIGYGLLYLQVTRGVARRDHAFPVPEVRPSLVVTARSLNKIRNEALAAKGIAVVSVLDNAGAESMSRPLDFCPTCSRGKRPLSRVRATRGSSTRRATSPKQALPMPGL